MKTLLLDILLKLRTNDSHYMPAEVQISTPGSFAMVTSMLLSYQFLVCNKPFAYVKIFQNCLPQNYLHDRYYLHYILQEVFCARQNRLLCLIMSPRSHLLLIHLTVIVATALFIFKQFPSNLDTFFILKEPLSK